MSTSRTILVLELVGVVVVAAIIGVVSGAPAPALAVGAALVGTALFTRRVAMRREAGAVAQDPRGLADFPVRLPAERVAVGRTFQVRLLPPTRKVWAPGMLCAAPGRLQFVPSEARHADRVWSAEVGEVEVLGTGPTATTVRIRSVASPAQFVVMQRRSDVEAAIGPYVRVAAT